MKRNDEVLFKKQVTGADIKPNAIVLEDLGRLNDVPVCRIKTGGEEWIVRHCELKTVEQVKQEWRNEIVKLKPSHKTKKALAAALKIDVRILNKRVALCEGVPMV